ncbi:glycoside hydrolase family 55 protein [Klebsiella pneumoniae]|uniref:glycoside hydrolase family 55 protein n=1 Tax=Klebsiella pneumoniae TaxID=573 RepID=UPI001FAC909A|nr:glycoside hydrolase family 55 protein [Klebsiella pneumoniae]MCI7871761.1 hypothetical protein [Klebsiella pneumoniae]MCI7903272.1 hypothetical protein [Klebsiella pneumoniae]
MTTYKTGNPLGSSAVKDLFDNAENLDHFENDRSNETWENRFGVPGKTRYGMEQEHDRQISSQEARFQQFLLSSGYVFLGDYQDGPFQFGARNQYIRYDNQYYRLNAATDVGFTTTGTDATSFASDVTHFALMDGDTLRQNLAALTGSSLIGGLGFISPEMFGAKGDGTTDDTEAFQSSLDAWVQRPGVEFRALGVYVLSSPLTVISPAQGSRCTINTLVQSSSWTDDSSLFSRTGCLINLDVGTSGSNMWGSVLHVECLRGISSSTTPTDFKIHGIRNLGWQQCEISVGLGTGFISIVNIVNSKSTTPTVRYKLRMGRNNLFNFLAPTYTTNMYEGCVFETMWSAGGHFGTEVLGQGSTYTHIRGGSADFAGSYLSFVAVTATPENLTLGQEVYLNGALIGWSIGLYYKESDSKTYLIIGEKNTIADSTGSAASSAMSAGSVITIGSTSYTVSSLFGGNNSHTTARFLPTAICIAPTTQTIVRWKIERDYDSGTCFPSAVYWADSRVDTANEVVRINTPLPLSCRFDGRITSGRLTLAGSRFATQLSVSNLHINSAGGFSTARHGSVWKFTGIKTVLVSDGTSTTTQAFTLADLGAGQITGRIFGRSTDPATDTIALWELTGFGINADGSLALDKWVVHWGGGNTFYILKTQSGTSFSLSSSVDSGGAGVLLLTGGMSTVQAEVGASWQYRITAVRTFML